MVIQGALPAGWPTSSKWRSMIASTLAAELGCRTYPLPVGSINPPCIVVVPTQTGSWFDRQRSERTTCTHHLNFDLLLIGGPHNTEASWLQVEEWAEALQGALDALHESQELEGYYGAPLSVGDINGPSNIELGGQTLLGAVAQLTAETHL